jgi:Family of unknown function (DUF6134)
MTPRACLFAILLVLSAEARPLDAPASYRYRIHHQIFGDIGEHRMTLARAGDAIVVEHTAELAVDILGLTAFHRRTRFREVWQSDRLIEFEGLVVDNGEPFPVSARAEGDRLVVEGSAGRTLAPAATAPSEPSIERAIRRDWFFDSKTGALLNASVTPAGREPLKIGDEVVEATKYEIAGELDQHVWFDAAGTWVQWRLWRQGAAITLVRE